MNDEFKDIERMLKSMPLRKAPPSLDARILRPRRFPRWSRALVGGLAAAAAAALALALWLPRHNASDPIPEEAPPQTAGLAPAPDAAARPGPQPGHTIEETVSHVTDQVLIAPDGQTPMRVLQQRTVNRTWVADESGRFVLDSAVPDDQIILVQAQIQ